MLTPSHSAIARYKRRETFDRAEGALKMFSKRKKAEMRGKVMGLGKSEAKGEMPVTEDVECALGNPLSLRYSYYIDIKVHSVTAFHWTMDRKD